MNRNTKLSPDIPAGYPLCLHADCPMAKLVFANWHSAVVRKWEPSSI